MLKHYNSIVFGSRATGKAAKFSDFDVGLQAEKKISPVTLMEIEEKLEQSDIPYKVELVDFSEVSGKFKEVALQKIVNLRKYI